MILNNLKIALRSIKSNFFYTSINIIGLAVGISASVIITFYVLDELSFDKFHTDAEQIYRVGLRAKISGQEVEAAATCPPMAATVQAEFPDVVEVIRLAQWQEIPVKIDDKAFTEKSVILADSNFFQFFSYKMLSGDPETALNEPQNVVLSETIAAKYFGDANPSDIIGQIIEIGNERFACKITGILENSPHNSHIPYDMILSMDTWEQSKGTMWVNNFLYNYVKLHPDADQFAVEEKFSELVIKYVGPEAAAVLGMDMENVNEDEFYYGYFLMPIGDIHLYSHLVAELKPPSDIKYVYTFAVIALFILFIAIINFVNLTTAKGGKRAKEVGIRKTAGALRGRLVVQFLMESTLQALIAMIIAGALIQLTMDWFNQIAQKELSFNALNDLWIAPSMLALAVLIGLLAGIYPAIYLTAFKPASVLRGTWGGSTKGKMIRSGLVIVQFAISTFLIISTLLVYKQMNLLRTHNPGFEKEQVMVIKNGSSLGGAFSSFRENLVAKPGISHLSKSTHLPPGIDNSSLFRADEGSEDYLMNHYWADYDQLEALNLEMAEGRYYSEDFPSDSLAIVINQVAMDRFGWESYEGHRILSFLSNIEGGVHVDVIGVVKDFNFRSLKEDIQPMAIMLGDFGNLISLKLSTDDYSAVISEVEDEWKELANGAPFDYYFLDQEFDKIYRAEQQMGELFMIFTILAIIIACLGLFGLATFTAEQKTKEIGIRKALGASLPNIVFTLSSDFIKLVGVAIIISMPLAYYIMNQWLQEFAYKTNFSVMMFVGTAVLVLLVALGTVSYQAISVGMSKPSDALKVE